MERTERATARASVCFSSLALALTQPIGGRLWGVQLSDGHSLLGAEDGLAFGSVHPRAALEAVYWLRK